MSIENGFFTIVGDGREDRLNFLDFGDGRVSIQIPSVTTINKGQLMELSLLLFAVATGNKPEPFPEPDGEVQDSFLELLDGYGVNDADLRRLRLQLLKAVEEIDHYRMADTACSLCGEVYPEAEMEFIGSDSDKPRPFCPKCKDIDDD